MNLLVSVFHMIRMARNIINREPPGRRLELLFTYLKIESKGVLVQLFPKLCAFRESLFGYTIEFFDFALFSYMFKDIFVSKPYHFRCLAVCPLIIDLGSNIGMSVLFFKKLYPRATVIAFEPDHQTFQKLERNVERNRWQGVELHNKAVWNRAGAIDFHHDPSHPGALRMSALAQRMPGSHQRVDSVLLSDYIQEEVDFLKMDIEGAEALVLEELACHDKLRFVKEMVIEYHHHIEPREDNLSTTLKLLEDNEFGYQMYTLTEGPVRREEFQDILLYAYRKSASRPSDEAAAIYAESPLQTARRETLTR